MRFHGLILVALLSLTEFAGAQTTPVAPGPNFLPPVLAGSEPPALPLPDSQIDIQAELKQFRQELRQLQISRENFSQNMKSVDAESEQASTQQRQELLNLLTKLARTGANRKPAAPPAKLLPKGEEPAVIEERLDRQFLEPESAEHNEPALSDTSTSILDVNDPLVTGDVADPFALGKVLFNRGDFVNAERAFRKSKVAPENEMTLRYLVATCLRRQSKWKQATELYKVVAESDRDPVLQKLAKWQVDNIRWHQESESQLEQLRKQREKRTSSKKTEPVNADVSVK